MKLQNATIVFLGVLSLAPPAAAVARPGAKPVFLPGSVLTASGSYVVTKSITGAAGPVIHICGADVDLDLNGFVVTNTGAGPTILVDSAGCGAAGPPDHVTIHDGTVVGGFGGIEATAGVFKVDIEDVKIHGTFGPGIHLASVPSAAIRRVQVSGASGIGILWDGPMGASFKSGTIEHSLIHVAAGGIHVLSSCSSVGILNNRIEEVLGTDGILLSDCEGSLVSENTIQHPLGKGINLVSNSHGNKLFDNVIFESFSHGIHIDPTCFDNLVLNNVVSSAGKDGAVIVATSDGIQAKGGLNHIDRNILNTNSGIGLHFCGPAACGNGFGRNLARNNTGGFAPDCPAGCGGPGAMGPALFPPNSCNTTFACPAVPGGANSTFGDNLIPGPPIF